MAKSVAVMKAGQVVEMGSRDQIFGAPENAYTQELMRSYASWAGVQ
jgi:ABC-type dipeptide/oligopeptide/nickel transport system ATPase component